jgi:hypothetical protein
MDHATCVVQPGGVDRSIVDSLHHGSLIEVVAASGFLGIFGFMTPAQKHCAASICNKVTLHHYGRQ